VTRTAALENKNHNGGILNVAQRKRERFGKLGKEQGRLLKKRRK